MNSRQSRRKRNVCPAYTEKACRIFDIPLSRSRQTCKPRKRSMSPIYKDWKIPMFDRTARKAISLNAR